jgi:hypothetical protein
MISKLWGVCRTQSCDPPRGLEIIWGMSNTVTSQLSGTVYPTCAWPSLILCTRSPTPAMILVAAHHAAPVSCTPQEKQVRFSTWTKIKVKPPKLPGFKFKPKRVDYSSQIKPRYWPLDFSISPLMSTLTTQRNKVWISNPRPHEAQLEDQKAKKSSRRSSRRRKNHKANKRHEKRQTKQNGKEELRKAQNQTQTQNCPVNKLSLTLSMQALPLR